LKFSSNERFKIFQIIDFDKVNEYKHLRKNDWVGFAHVYLWRCNKESKSDDQIDKEIYTKLVELDTRLGTTATEQLFWRVSYEKKRLNGLGGKILREAGLDFEEWKDFDWIKKETYDYGYAEYYLRKFQNYSKMINEADATVYQKLVDIDSTLGTKLSDQLFECLRLTTRCDIIKVLKFLQIKDLKIL